MDKETTRVVAMFIVAEIKKMFLGGMPSFNKSEIV